MDDRPLSAIGVPPLRGSTAQRIVLGALLCELVLLLLLASGFLLHLSGLMPLQQHFQCLLLLAQREPAQVFLFPRDAPTVDLFALRANGPGELVEKQPIVRQQMCRDAGA